MKNKWKRQLQKNPVYSATYSFFCHESEKWLKNLIRKSTRISGAGEKQRHKFFKISQEKITSLVSKISTG